MSKIEIDGREYLVDGTQNLLHACLSVGLDLPYFCWHPALGSVGACRQCAVVAYRDQKDDKGRIVMACMTPASDGARLSVQAPQAVDFRATVVEWLMLNHPHDCPVCEEGGECHLQDMTVMTGHTSRRYRGRKRTFENQYLGPFLKHEMNRCITCYRCVRFYGDYAGGSDLAAFGSRDRMYFGRHTDGVLENPFSGNLVEVCPTGVFTDKPFGETYTRKWDLQSAPSVCGGCAVGCNTSPGERYGRLKRVHNRYHHDINGYFLCDRGRFGAGFVNESVRLRNAGQRRDDGAYDELTADAAVTRLAALISDRDVVGIGSPRASLESNVALRALVGANRFSTGLGATDAVLVSIVLQQLAAAPDACPTIADVESADAILVLGEDVLNTAPRIALALRQAVRNRAFDDAREVGIPLWQDVGVRSHAQRRLSPLFIATLRSTALDDVATGTVRGDPAALTRLAREIAARLRADTAPGASGETSMATTVAAALRGAKRPLIVSGTGAGSAELLKAAAEVAAAVGPACGLLQVIPECNSLGAALVDGDLSVVDALQRAREGAVLIVLENDLYRRAPVELVVDTLTTATVAVLDSVATATAQRASLVLPVASFVECEGTYVNYESRAQRFFAVYEPAAPIAPAWRWLSRAANALGCAELSFHHVDDITAHCATLPNLSGVSAAAPSANYRGAAFQRIARQPHRYSGRTAMHADRNVHEPKARLDDESPLAFSMEGVNSAESALRPFVWSPGWNSNQAVARFQQEVGGPLRGGDPGVRLITRDAVAIRDVPLPVSLAAQDGLHLLPLYEIFGSDELSAYAPAIIERMSEPTLVLNPTDAQRLGVTTGEGVRCADLTFAVRLDADMAPGCAGYVRGLPGSWSEAPAAATLERDPTFKPNPTVFARG